MTSPRVGLGGTRKWFRACLTRNWRPCGDPWRAGTCSDPRAGSKRPSFGFKSLTRVARAVGLEKPRHFKREGGWHQPGWHQPRRRKAGKPVGMTKKINCSDTDLFDESRKAGKPASVAKKINCSDTVYLRGSGVRRPAFDGRLRLRDVRQRCVGPVAAIDLVPTSFGRRPPPRLIAPAPRRPSSTSGCWECRRTCVG